MREPNEARNPIIENRGLQLYAEEVRIVRIERGVQIALNCGQINAIVFRTRVISHHREGQEREGQQHKQRESM